ncbi:hypothetical protein RIF29_08281 [Crotalaria pallida]|uniref:Uncharacterized protein n=1 Tax=Crotalaria pallida TaxID=3830 RepID=A0AAN9J590_CROPI
MYVYVTELKRKCLKLKHSFSLFSFLVWLVLRTHYFPFLLLLSVVALISPSLSVCLFPTDIYEDSSYNMFVVVNRPATTPSLYINQCKCLKLLSHSVIL